MECSQAREALSAWADGEQSPYDEPAVRAHVAGCAGCAAYEAGLGGLARLAAPEQVPDLAGAVLARQRRRRESRVFVLRWGVGMMGGAELANAVYSFAVHGGQEGHATHESLSFTVAICLGLIFAAVRPALARGYLPVIGTAVGLLLLTAALDVSSGRVAALDELPHVDLLVGAVLLWLLGREQPRGPGLAGDGSPWRPRPPSYAGLRVVSRTLLRPARVGLGTLLAAGLVLVGGPASAHAVLQGSDPGPDTVLATAPRQVSLRFDETVTVPAGAVRVYAPDGSRADDGDVRADGATVTVGLDAGAQGTYLVSWRVVSADSHPVSGAFSFSVGKESAAPAAPRQTSDTGLSVGLGVARWAGYLGAALLVGGLLVLGWCWPGGWASRRVRWLLLGGAALLALASVAALLVKGPLDAGLGWGAVGRGGPLREVLGSTYGRATLARVVLSLLLGGLVVGRARLSPRVLGVVGGLLGAAVAVSFALAGHAAAGEVWPLALVSESVHVLAMSVWLGGLLVLVAGAAWRAPQVRTVLVRFSSLALGSVAALVVTGLFQAWRQVGSLDALTATTYGRELAAKTGLVVLVLGVALGSRQLLRRRDPLASLRRSMTVEAVAVAAVLGVTSALVATEPARSAYRPTVAANLDLAGDTVQVSAVPAGDRQADLHLYVFRGGVPSDPAELTAAVSLPAASIGPLPVSLAVAGPGHRQGVVAVPVVGTWRLAVTVRTSEVDEETGYVELPVR